MDVRFTTLGRVALTVDGVPTAVPGRRERSVLATLLAARGAVVPVERFVDDIWGDEAGPATQASLQVAVSRLRLLVEPGRAPRAPPRSLVTDGLGYALLTARGAVDSDEFTILVDRAHAALADHDAAYALEVCGRAAALWQGTPYGDAARGRIVRAETARLEDLHVTMSELRAEAMLALGQHALASAELERLVVAYPGRERLRELHALALYRSGRQGDALGSLRQAREVLVDELGLDPSSTLQRLETDVLDHAAGLDLARGPGAAAANVTPGPRPAPAVSTSTVLDRPDLTGREPAMAVLDAALTQTLAGRSATAVVAGDAGIGKSRLVEEFAARASARGARVIWGQAHGADVSPAYWPWIRVIRDLAPVHPDAVISELLSPTGGLSHDDPAATTLRTYDAVSRLVADTAADTPLVIVLDDLQWADPSSAGLLAYAARALLASRVLLIATLRDTVAPSNVIDTCLAELARLHARRITLRGLTGAQITELIGRWAGVTDPVLGAIVAQRTDGNPFCVVELVRVLAAEDRLDPAGARDAPVPEGVRDVMRLRLALLSAPVRALLGVASVVGREFDLGLVHEAAGLPVGTALDLLDEAARMHIVEETDHVGRYRFTHILVQQAQLDALAPTRRGHVHAAVAAALERRDDPDLASDLAHHTVLGAAVEPALRVSAVRHLVAAARVAESRGANDEALQYWEQALIADGLVDDAAPRRRYDILIGLARARSGRSQIAPARNAVGLAIEIGRALGDLTLVAEAATGNAGNGVHWRQAGTSDPWLTEVLTTCVDSLPAGALRVRALAALALELANQWRPVASDAATVRSLAEGADLADRALDTDLVGVRTTTMWGRPGTAPERLTLAATALSGPLAEDRELSLRLGAGAAHLQLGESAAARRDLARCGELARRLRYTGVDISLAWWRFYRAIEEDDPAAPELADEAIRVHRERRFPTLAQATGMAELRLAGAGAPVGDTVHDLARDSPSPGYRAFVAHALAESGRSTEAVHLLGAGVPDGAWDVGSTYAECLRVEVLADAGPSVALSRSLDRIAPWGAEFALWGTVDCAGSIHHFVGRGLEANGDRAAARRAYGRAIEADTTARMGPWRRRSQQRLAGLDARTTAEPSQVTLPGRISPVS